MLYRFEVLFILNVYILKSPTWLTLESCTALRDLGRRGPCGGPQGLGILFWSWSLWSLNPWARSLWDQKVETMNSELPFDTIVVLPNIYIGPQYPNLSLQKRETKENTTSLSVFTHTFKFFYNEGYSQGRKIMLLFFGGRDRWGAESGPRGWCSCLVLYQHIVVHYKVIFVRIEG